MHCVFCESFPALHFPMLPLRWSVYCHIINGGNCRAATKTETLNYIISSFFQFAGAFVKDYFDLSENCIVCLQDWFQIIEQVGQIATVSAFELIHSTEKNTSAVQSKVSMLSFWLRQLPSPSRSKHAHTHTLSCTNTLTPHNAVDLLQCNSPQGQLAPSSSKTSQINSKSETNTWRACFWGWIIHDNRAKPNLLELGHILLSSVLMLLNYRNSDGIFWIQLRQCSWC